MKKYDQSLFFKELRQAIEHFYGTSGNDSLCQMSDFIYSLQGIAAMLQRTNNDCANPEHMLALDALATVSEKLVDAHSFREIVAHLRGLNGKKHRVERAELLEELASLIRFCYVNIAMGRR